MKVLLRNFDGKEYEWKDAEFVEGRIKVDGAFVYQTNIVSIADDNRSEYVKCTRCGATFKKNSPELEAHRNRYKDVNNCLKCQYLGTTNKRIIGANYELQPDGRYKHTVESVCALYCQYNSWLRSTRGDINSEETRNNCYMKTCSTAEMVAVEDIFTQNPGIFDDIITVDKIIAIGYKSMLGVRGGTRYALKGRNNIQARINNLGIVDRFDVKYGHNSWGLVYSKKFDKLYTASGYEYAEWRPGNMSVDTKNYIKKKISELYV